MIGTDTGVGKTHVSCALLHAFAQQGLRAVGMKPVAAGCLVHQGGLLSEDVAALLAAGNVDATPGEINPYAFAPPLAPHIAAQMAGIDIEFSPILAAFEALQSRVDVVVVEGVGGFRVPLNAHQDTADLALALKLPMILVVGMRLGCLNHALLTAEAIAARGLHLAGWVANRIDGGIVAFEENVAALEVRLSAPCIAVMPFSKTGDYRVAALDLKLDRLFLPD